ncbi:MAG: TonB-dependent receptor [Verrucomicrobia bacterium]|nr:TonB-dependent receptor [Verrucomicrobiota bacterium]
MKFHLSLLLALCSALRAADTGTVTGRVSDAATGAYLEGADISVAAQSAQALSARDGSFAFALPAGTHAVRVFYTGLEVATQTIVVTAGRATELNVPLSAAATVRMEAFKVAGAREGNAAAITRQRNAENVMNAVSMDAFGNVADGNIGNFLQNLAGVAVTKEAGDIVGIGLRGAPPELNSITLDGTRTASAVAGFTPNGDRAGLIDQIPADFIKEIEVTKGNTPDMPADSLGGAINLVTKSAFDFKERVITYRGGINLNTYRDGRIVHQQLAPVDLGKYGPTAALTYLDTFGKERNVGLSLSGAYSQTINTRDRVQMSRPNLANFISTQARQLNDANTRLRAGLSAKFEYRFDATARVAVSAGLNYFAFDGDRVDWNITSTNRVADYARVSRAQIEAGAVPRDSANQTAGLAPGFTDTRNELLDATVLNRPAHEFKRSHQYKIGVEGQKRWGDARIDASVSFNPSSFDNNYWGLLVTKTGGVGLTIDSSRDTTRPVFAQTYGPRIGVGTDFNNYTAQRYEQPDITREEIADARVDVRKRLPLGEVVANLKTGFDYRTQHRWLKTYRPTWNLVGADRVQGRAPGTGVNDDGIAQFLAPWTYSIFNNSMLALDTLDYRLGDASFLANPASWTPSGTSVATRPVPRINSEQVAAGYAQLSASFGRLNVLGGARFEHTASTGVGSFADPLSPAQTSVRVSRAYQAWYPSLHLRYAARPNLLLRASYSTSGARPSLGAIVPNTSVSYLTDGSGLGRVTQNNPGLKPQFTRTYDVSAEYYIEPAGVLSAGFFRKDISNFIASANAVIAAGADNGFGGNYANFDLTTTGNLGTAFVEGVELNYSQRLRRLPKPFDGLSVFANYTGLRTQGSYANGAAELANFVPRTYNAGLAFAWRKLEARVTYHYKSGYLSGYSAVLTSQTRVMDDPTVDLNFQYRLRPACTLFVDYINIFNNSPDWWHVTKRHITMSELYGARLNVGVSGRF